MVISKFIVCRCGNEIEKGRAELGLKTCLSCAKRTNQPKVKGRMVYFHKTGGEIEVMSAQSFSENKKYFHRTGNRSILKQV